VGRGRPDDEAPSYERRSATWEIEDCRVVEGGNGVGQGGGVVWRVFMGTSWEEHGGTPMHTGFGTGVLIAKWDFRVYRVGIFLRKGPDAGEVGEADAAVSDGGTLSAGKQPKVGKMAGVGSFQRGGGTAGDCVKGGHLVAAVWERRGGVGHHSRGN